MVPAGVWHIDQTVNDTPNGQVREGRDERGSELATAALLLPSPQNEHQNLSIFMGFAGKKEGRRADSNR